MPELRRTQPSPALLAIGATLLIAACMSSESVLFEEPPVTNSPANVAGSGGSASGASSGGALASSGGTGASGAPSSAAGAPSGGALAVGGAGAGGEAGQSGAELPADILDLRSWQLSLPVPSASDAERPTEVRQPQLSTFALGPFFTLNGGGDGVLFRAPAGGVTAEDSNDPSTVLRETTYGGAQLAAWSTRVGSHSLLIRQAIVALPADGSRAIVGAIRHRDRESVRIRLDQKRLFVEAEGEEPALLEADYRLGTPFTVKLVAGASTIAVYYEDLGFPKLTVPRQADDCYFEAGVQLQTKQERVGADAYAEVVIWQLQLEHGP